VLVAGNATPFGRGDCDDQPGRIAGRRVLAPVTSGAYMSTTVGVRTGR